MPDRFSIDDIYSARGRIKGLVYRTPLEESLYLGRDGRRYFFKLECLQTVRSFKIRGALSRMTALTEEQRERGVATVSSGNHGSSVSYAAKLLGIKNAVIIVPEPTPQTKIDRIRFCGGKVLFMGKDYNEAHELGLRYIASNGLTYIDPYYDDPMVYGGQGTIGLEILEQDPDIDTVVCPIGGGGLITGIAVAVKTLKPGIRVIGAQTEACPAMIAAIRDHVFYEDYPITGDSLCDALLGGVGKLSYEMLPDYIDDIIEVRESSIKKAVKHMLLQEKIVAEGGSATAVAAVMDEPERVGGRKIALIISGGNIDGSILERIVKE